MNKLYDPECANSWVWQMVPKNHKPGTPCTYQLTSTPSPKAYEERGYILINPVQLGMYDEHGYYMTYKPPVEGIFPGKYVRVLQDHQLEKAKDKYESDKIYARHGGRKLVGAMA
jgi:hypothetical protein